MRNYLTLRKLRALFFISRWEEAEILRKEDHVHFCFYDVALIRNQTVYRVKVDGGKINVVGFYTKDGYYSPTPKQWQVATVVGR